jgi:hypothetical protein
MPDALVWGFRTRGVMRHACRLLEGPICCVRVELHLQLHHWQAHFPGASLDRVVEREQLITRVSPLPSRSSVRDRCHGRGLQQLGHLREERCQRRRGLGRRLDHQTAFGRPLNGEA